MKSLPPVAAALAVLACTARLAFGDLVIVQKVDAMGQSGEMTMKVSADKVRVDMSPAVSTIVDATTGDVTTLMHPQKAYMVVSAAAAKALQAQMRGVMQQSLGSATSTPAPVKATGRKQNINGYDAAEYTFTNGTLKATYWIAANYPNAQAVTDALAKFQKGGVSDMTRDFAPDIKSLPGVPVRTEVEINGQKLVTELESVTEAPSNPADYTVPAGYTEMKMPAMPPGGLPAGGAPAQ